MPIPARGSRCTIPRGPAVGRWSAAPAPAPQWAGIIAITNQERAVAGTDVQGLSTTAVSTQANAVIYTTSLTKAAQDFHDVTSGRNSGGFSARPATMPSRGLAARLSVGWSVTGHRNEGQWPHLNQQDHYWQHPGLRRLGWIWWGGWGGGEVGAAGVAAGADGTVGALTSLPLAL